MVKNPTTQKKLMKTTKWEITLCPFNGLLENSSTSIKSNEALRGEPQR